MTRLTRRGFVQRSSVAIGAVGGIGLVAAPRAAVAAEDLTPKRRGTYQALVGLLAARNALPSDPRSVSAAGERFLVWHGDLPRSMRSHVNRVLDDVERGLPGGFAGTPSTGQAAHLRELQRGGGDRGVVAAAALALASPPYGESNDIKVAPLSL
jgi:hypothetical protein